MILIASILALTGAAWIAFSLAVGRSSPLDDERKTAKRFALLGLVPIAAAAVILVWEYV